MSHKIDIDPPTRYDYVKKRRVSLCEQEKRDEAQVKQLETVLQKSNFSEFIRLYKANNGYIRLYPKPSELRNCLRLLRNDISLISSEKELGLLLCAYSQDKNKLFPQLTITVDVTTEQLTPLMKMAQRLILNNTNFNMAELLRVQQALGEDCYTTAWSIDVTDRQLAEIHELIVSFSMPVTLRWKNNRVTLDFNKKAVEHAIEIDGDIDQRQQDKFKSIIGILPEPYLCHIAFKNHGFYDDLLPAVARIKHLSIAQQMLENSQVAALENIVPGLPDSAQFCLSAVNTKSTDAARRTNLLKTLFDLQRAERLRVPEKKKVLENLHSILTQTEENSFITIDQLLATAHYYIRQDYTRQHYGNSTVCDRIEQSLLDALSKISPADSGRISAGLFALQRFMFLRRIAVYSELTLQQLMPPLNQNGLKESTYKLVDKVHSASNHTELSEHLTAFLERVNWRYKTWNGDIISEIKKTITAIEPWVEFVAITTSSSQVVVDKLKGAEAKGEESSHTVTTTSTHVQLPKPKKADYVHSGLHDLLSQVRVDKLMVPDYLRDEVTDELMVNPVLCRGYVYDKHTLVNWFVTCINARTAVTVPTSREVIIPQEEVVRENPHTLLTRLIATQLQENHSKRGEVIAFLQQAIDEALLRQLPEVPAHALPSDPYANASAPPASATEREPDERQRYALTS